MNFLLVRSPNSGSTIIVLQTEIGNHLFLIKMVIRFARTALNYGMIHPTQSGMSFHSMDNVVTLEEVLRLTEHLSLADKVSLLEQMAPKITQELVTVQPTPRKSLLGIWRRLDSIEAEIAEARREMWSNFPRRGA